MEMDELTEFVAGLRRRIEALGPWPERVPERQYQKASQQCPRCLFFIPDEQYLDHFEACRYECGLCGIRIENRKAFISHCGTCAAEYDRGRR